MRIDARSLSRAVSGGGGTPKSALVRQIKKLEQKKKQLMEKLSGKAGAGDTAATAAGLAQTHTQQKAAAADKELKAVQTSVAATASQVGTAKTAVASVDTTLSPTVAAAARAATTPRPAPVAPTATPRAMPMPQPATGGSGLDAMLEAAEAEMDPKQIMKLITMLDSQIMMLKQRLSKSEEAELAALSGDDDEDDNQGSAMPAAEAAVEMGTEELPAPVVEAGHVDGYV